MDAEYRLRCGAAHYSRVERGKKRYRLGRCRQLHELICARDVFAEDPAAARLGHRRDHSLELLEIVAGMIGMRIVSRPEKFILADNLHHRRDSTFVGIGGDETLALEVVRRLLLEPDRRAEGGAVEDGVAAIEEVTDPSGLRFEHYRAQFRKAVEDPELEERAEGVLHALSREQIVIPRGPGEIVIAMVDAEAGGLEGRMNRERDAEILRRGEERVVTRVA